MENKQQKTQVQGKPITKEEFKAMIEAKKQKAAEEKAKRVEEYKNRIERRRHRRPGFVPKTEK